MINTIKNKCRLYQTKFSFGSTSAIITNLGLITSLDRLSHPKLSIIAGILVIALADNIADSAGIHIFQESECINQKEVWVSTITNFLSRVLVSLTFILLVVFLPLSWAVIASIAWGLFLLAIISYSIAQGRGLNPYLAIIEHLAIAIFVILASSYVSKLLLVKFQ